mmetsp:Transcript_24936/g.38446  ORF Transcript_24936/g.38446 Transcript_24936/m.38446 type:complete len:220 (-) Transcript_24936:463-1122(-)
MQHVMIMRIARVTFAFLKGARQAKGDHRKHVEITKIVSSMLVLSKLSPDLHKWCVVPTVLVNSFMIGRFLLIQNLMMVASARVRPLGIIALSTNSAKVGCVYLVNVRVKRKRLVQLVMKISIVRAVFVFPEYAWKVGKMHLNHVRKMKIAKAMHVVSKLTRDLHKWYAAQVVTVILYMIGNTLSIPKAMMGTFAQVKPLVLLVRTMLCVKAEFVCQGSV